MNPELLKELKSELSLVRLLKVGLFKKMPIDNSEFEKEITLHRAVLDRALVDYFSVQPDIRDEVLAWLDLNNPDFIQACQRADLEPQGVFDTFKIMRKIIRGYNARFISFGKIC